MILPAPERPRCDIGTFASKHSGHAGEIFAKCTVCAYTAIYAAHTMPCLLKMSRANHGLVPSQGRSQRVQTMTCCIPPEVQPLVMHSRFRR